MPKDELMTQMGLFIRSSYLVKFLVLDDLYKRILNVPGDIFEFGVYKGGTINYLAHKMPNSIIYGFDSFQGLPEDWRKGFKKAFMISVHNTILLFILNL